MMGYPEYTKVIIAIVAIINPLGAVPLFLSLTSGETPQEQKRIAKITAISVAVILIFSVWTGEPFLQFFGISVSAFRVAGGLLVLLMGVAMIHGHMSHAKHTPAEDKEAQGKDSVAVVPLAIPLIAGPGAISLVIMDSHNAETVTNKLLLSAGIVVVAALVWVILYIAKSISKILGTTGINIFTRVMGLLLAAIGIEFITGGLRELLPGLGK